MNVKYYDSELKHFTETFVSTGTANWSCIDAKSCAWLAWLSMAIVAARAAANESRPFGPPGVSGDEGRLEGELDKALYP